MLKPWTRTVIAGALVAVIAPVGVPGTLAAQAGCDPDAEPANLNFTLQDLNGRDVALSAYKGKVILLNFWATWCGPCRIEIPGFVELYRDYESQGFVVLGVSIDDPVAKLRTFTEELKVNYPILIGDGRDDVKSAYPLVGLPTTLLIGRDGVICRKHTGLALREQLEPIIQFLLPAGESADSRRGAGRVPAR